MNTDIKIFTSPVGADVHVVVIDNEPWFVAKDVCKCLGLDNVGQAMSYLDEDEKKTIDSNIISNDVGSNWDAQASQPLIFLTIR